MILQTVCDRGAAVQSAMGGIIGIIIGSIATTTVGKLAGFECYANPDGSDRVLQCFCCHWPVLRLYAGSKTGGKPESNRCAAGASNLHYHPSRWYTLEKEDHLEGFFDYESCGYALRYDRRDL